MLLLQGCMASPPDGQAGGSNMSSILALIIIIIIFILPIVIVKNKRKNYIEKYITFLGKNGKHLTSEDENLLRTLVKSHYKNTIIWSISGVVIYGLLGSRIISLSPSDMKYAVIFNLLIMILNILFAFSKFKRSCPYCKNKVKLDAERCPKCTKDIGNSWVGKPILEQFHKG